MICPNCGRELADGVRVCPSCSAVQRVFRRRSAEVNIDAPEQRVRVERRTTPEARPDAQARPTRQGSSSSPVRPAKAQQPRKTGSGNIPVGLRVQDEKRREPVREVRRAPGRTKRKLDASPAMLAPPIYQKSHKKLGRIIWAIMLLLIFVTAALCYFMMGTEDGHILMAQWDWELAPTDAYVTIGRNLHDQAYFTKSLEKLKIAVEREPDNVDALVLMGQDYTELGRIDEAKAIYETLINDIAPNHPAAYRNLIKIYQSEGYNAEALALMKTASENASTNSQEFEVMLREYTPTAPSFNMQEGRYNKEIDVIITVPEGQTVYYSVDGTDPSESGMVYEAGTKIHVPEGKMTLKAIGFTDNGTPSEQISADYAVIIPTPSAPKANIASGKLKKAVKVALRSGDDPKDPNYSPIVAFYYTLDGRPATTDGTLYDPEEQIQLPIGKCELRAIGIAENGKQSYEMIVTYDVEGNLKRMFRSEDTFKGMELYSTTYSRFTKNWGTPSSYEVLPVEEWYSPEMESYEAVYDWGTARFLIKKEGANPVLYALDTTNTSMTAPRSTKIGMDGDDVVEKFRDLGYPDRDDLGNRLLYNYSSETVTENTMFGTYQFEGDGRYAIHYYYPIGDKNEIFAELSYYLDEDKKVERIVWQRYMAEVTATAESGS